MIRSDYLSKRTVTLEYRLYLCTFVLGLVLRTTHCEEECQSFNTSLYLYDEGYKHVMNISGRNYTHFKVKTCHNSSSEISSKSDKSTNQLEWEKTHVGFYIDDITYIKIKIVYGRNFCRIRKKEDRNESWMTVADKTGVWIPPGGQCVEFWISYDNGVFKLRRNSSPGSEPVIEYDTGTSTSTINRVAIKSRGEWCSFDMDDGTHTAEETSSTVSVDNTTSSLTLSTNRLSITSMTSRSSDDGTRSAEQTSSTVISTVTPTPTPPTPHIPMNMSMTPSYGPVSGGTEVNITGSYLDSITELWLGSNLTYEFNFTLMESGNISAVTPTYRILEPNETGVTLNVTIQLNDVRMVTDVQFTYKPDPQVVDIYPRKMTKSGGLTVTVEGSSLDSVAAPMLTVTVIKRSDQNQRKTYDSPCEAETPKQLLCVTPKIPENSFSTKRKRHTTDNRRRRQSNDEELDFVLGLQFDGADNYEDLTDNLPHLAHIEVHQDPSFSPGQMFSFDPEFAGAIGIKGENIDAGVVVADYNVRIGKGFCTNIGITSDKLYCNPPLTLDEVADGNSINTTRAHNEVDITVRVGTNLVYTVGYIVYDIEETISLYTIFVPVVAALGALLVVFVIILIVCCCRKARAKKDSDKTLAPSAQDLNTLEPSRNDNYYTDETQPKNQYYMVVNQGANGQ